MVFDCSAKFNGRSINKELLSGPDLTNQLVGVLIGFHQEQVAVIGDIESMFYQVWVFKEHRSLLRFLWWKDGDLNNPPIDHEIGHVFGVSSPSCINYAFKKKTADDNKVQYGIDAADTLNKNFYVDDMLKSVASVPKAITLVENVRGMCRAGGFRLTKFVSNSEELQMSAPQKDRQQPAPDRKLLETIPDNERALGVLWNIGDDKMGFQVHMKEKPLTRQGMLSSLSSIYNPLGIAAPLMLEERRIIQSLCHQNLEWDEQIPDNMARQWAAWKSNLLTFGRHPSRKMFQTQEI